MKKTQITTGLNDLLNPTTAPATAPTEKEAKAAKDYKTYCYSLPVEVAEKIEYIARYDRRKQNAVLAEAINQYAARWTPAPEPKPRTFAED